MTRLTEDRIDDAASLFCGDDSPHCVVDAITGRQLNPPPSRKPSRKSQSRKKKRSWRLMMEAYLARVQKEAGTDFLSGATHEDLGMSPRDFAALQKLSRRIRD